MTAVTPVQPKLSAVFTLPVIVASLGYLVVVYVLLLLNIVGVPSF